ncbi:e1dbc09b-baa8-4fd7-9ec8-a0e8c6e786b4-CDS [Sclerotinia trifoliorum]|uniref:E1dbc09b-baa8-4fd7-9ec8-a0e8c6e786b4-CDS n=1 Tax=Sclerotinia trifoliorum TaxID=28548 RepID=A0A8H2W4C5_9HELO|nr:e1dbc09b-baa8-4fd7-9ec8-a0e8c6e786b4-CDS [Sclerotinia trifoliorum]
MSSTLVLTVEQVEVDGVTYYGPREKKKKKRKRKKNIILEPTTREEIVKIDIGSAAHNRHTFEVPKTLLCDNIKYFNEILNGHPRDEPLRLLHLEPTSFALFLEWIQTGKYAPFKIENGFVAFMTRIILYGLADEFGIPQLMDYTMSALMSNYTKYDELTPTEKDGILVYMDTTPGSKLRSFIAFSLAISSIATKDSLLRLNKIAWMEHFGHAELGKDVWIWMNRIKAGYLKGVLGQNQKVSASSLRSFAPSKCSFHVHPEGLACAFMGDIF